MRDRMAYRVFSRCLDYTFVLAVFMLLFWLLAACWIAIRLTSPGGAIFSQPRVGKGGKIFTCYKFRTMRSGVRQAATHEMSADSVTPLGLILRKTKIDELPQAVNLFLGQMSLIGPRPCLPSQRDLVDWREKLGVLTIRPGITGLAQVRGVDMSEPEKLARLDAQYIATRSLRLDISILFDTLRGSGSRDYVRH